MSDLRPAIAPKSDQLNADDLIAGPITITLTRVAVSAGEQPISIGYEGDNGKPWKPCKSMARVLVLLWGADGKAYAGRSVRLYRDPDVRFGPDKVGGIRISHMSHIDGERTVALTTTRGRRAPYTVKPLPNSPSPSSASAPAGPPPSIQWAGAQLEPDHPQALEIFPGADRAEWQQAAKALKACIQAASTSALAQTWWELNEERFRAASETMANTIAAALPMGAAA